MHLTRSTHRCLVGTDCDEDPVDHRRRRGDVLRQLLPRQRAGGRADGARARRHAGAGLHADADRRAERQPAATCCLAASASTCSSTRRSSARRRGCSIGCGIRRGVIGAFAGRGVSTDARLLGELTISMLQGEQRRAAQGVRQAGRLDAGRTAARRHQPAELAADRDGGAAQARVRAAGVLHAAGRRAVSRAGSRRRIAIGRWR